MNFTHLYNFYDTNMTFGLDQLYSDICSLYVKDKDETVEYKKIMFINHTSERLQYEGIITTLVSYTSFKDSVLFFLNLLEDKYVGGMEKVGVSEIKKFVEKYIKLQQKDPLSKFKR